LIIDPNAVLTLAAAFQLFETIARRHSKILKGDGAVEEQELPPRRPLDPSEPRNVCIVKQLFRVDRSK
jgi:hypothetical protein